MEYKPKFKSIKSFINQYGVCPKCKCECDVLGPCCADYCYYEGEVISREDFDEDELAEWDKENL